MKCLPVAMPAIADWTSSGSTVTCRGMCTAAGGAKLIRTSSPPCTSCEYVQMMCARQQTSIFRQPMACFSIECCCCHISCIRFQHSTSSTMQVRPRGWVPVCVHSMRACRG
jgi:hypothetical protein